MIKVITLLCFFTVLCISIDLNDAATNVFYVFHIKEVPKVRNVTKTTTDSPCNSTKVDDVEIETNTESSTETEEIITGWRSSLFFAPSNDSETGETLFEERADFTHDEDGYQVKYNVSEVLVDDRLSPTLLKVITG
ncbi:uncharacterized protein LOC132784986 [Drosophila nasuta]|uniref:uncharacterized protein LOC132784986 n=1 Tax=Drosophila nasuta TaxID=42062 RepID=UPI00295F2E4C|nr:uncharacterized protein LOC132784986 [Drosophila nasuta]